MKGTQQTESPLTVLHVPTFSRASEEGDPSLVIGSGALLGAVEDNRLPLCHLTGPSPIRSGWQYRRGEDWKQDGEGQAVPLGCGAGYVLSWERDSVLVPVMKK